MLEIGPTPHVRRMEAVRSLDSKLPDPPPLAALDFLVGRWEGEAFGGWVEESWGPAKAGSMLGSFRLVVDGQTSFYELMVIEAVEGRPTLRVKHFSPDLEPWEQGKNSVDFALIDVEGTTAWFDGLTLHRSADWLLGYLAMSQDGTISEVEFRFRRAR